MINDVQLSLVFWLFRHAATEFFWLIFPPHSIQNEIDAIDKRKRMHGAKIIKYQNWILCSVSYFIIRQDAQPDKTVVFHPYTYIWNIKMIVMPPTEKTQRCKMSNHSSVFIISLIISNRFFSKIVLFKFCHWGLHLIRLQHFPFTGKIEEIPSGERCVERKPVIYSTNTYFMLKYQTQ